MKGAAISVLCLAIGVQAFKDTAPLLIWGNEQSDGAIQDIQSSLTSATVQAQDVYGQLRQLGCDWNDVAVVHVRGLHQSHLSALTLPKSSIAIPYLVNPSRSALDLAVTDLADVCGAVVGTAGENDYDSTSGRKISQYEMSPKTLDLPRADIVILTSAPLSSSPTPPRTVSVKPKAKRSKYLAPLQDRQELEGGFADIEAELKQDLQEGAEQLKELLGYYGEDYAEVEDEFTWTENEEGSAFDEEYERPSVADADAAYADAPSPTQLDSQATSTRRPHKSHRPRPSSSHKAPHNGTVDPHAPLLDRVQLFTTPLLSAILVSLFVFVPIILIGVGSLAGIQVPPRLMEISKGAQISKEKKDQ